ncbi:MAG: hypothetical protein V4628_09735 [Pseudomonadota bacterium]
MENSRSKRKTFLPILSLCAWCFLLPSAKAQNSQDYFELITEYINKIDNIYDGTWTYTLAEEDKLENETTVRRVDPSQPFLDSDVLISVNGQPPTPVDVKEHQRRLKKRIQRRAMITSRREPRTEEEKRRRRLEQNGNEKERFLAMLIPESIKFVKQEGPLLYLQFEASEEGREAIFEALQGTLVLNTEQEFIQEVQARNTAIFSPFFLTEVEEAFLSLNFALVDGKPMQQNMTWKLVGQAFLFKDLDGEREVVWSDFVKSRN